MEISFTNHHNWMLFEIWLHINISFLYEQFRYLICWYPLMISLKQSSFRETPQCILLFTASDLASITSHIHSWVLFLLWLHPFVLSGVISLLISSSILGTYRPGEFIFQCLIFLPFHTVMGFSRQEY